MYTVCPKCALPLAVTAADLRAGQGYVRCGRCANVFNALLRLSDEAALPQDESAQRAALFSSGRYIEEMGKASATMSRPALSGAELEPELEPEQESRLFQPPPPRAAEPKPMAFEDPEFEDPDVTNPKIGKAPLNLVPPAAASLSTDLWRLDSSEPPPIAELEIEEELEEEPDEPARPTPQARAPQDQQAQEPREAPAASEDNEIDEDFDYIDEGDPQYRGTGTFQTIVLEGDTFLQTDETIPEEVLASEIASVSRRLAEANDTGQFAALMESRFEEGHLEEEPVAEDTPAPEVDAAPELAALREATGEFKHESKLAWESAEPNPFFRAVRSWGDWRLIAGAAALVLLLTLQMVNHWRDDLATRPGWYGPMRTLASAFGESLHPDWDLNAYDVRQSGAASEGPDNQTLTVRLSLTNVGERAQVLPLIRLTLRDRFGKAVSRAELTPAQYLPQALQTQSMIRRDQRIDTELRVLDPSRQASSFELDVCVTAASGGLRCAGDAPALAARQS